LKNAGFCLSSRKISQEGVLEVRRGLKPRCQADRSHNPSDEVNRVSVVREICMLRLSRRGLETGFREPSTLPVRAWG